MDDDEVMMEGIRSGCFCRGKFDEDLGLSFVVDSLDVLGYIRSGCFWRLVVLVNIIGYVDCMEVDDDEEKNNDNDFVEDEFFKKCGWLWWFDVFNKVVVLLCKVEFNVGDIFFMLMKECMVFCGKLFKVCGKKFGCGGCGSGRIK